MSFRRRRFAEAIDRQLDLFAHENADLLGRIETAHGGYAQTREDPEEHYSELLDLVELATDELDDIRDTFAARLDEDAADEYTAAFAVALRKRFPTLRAGG